MIFISITKGTEKKMNETKNITEINSNIITLTEQDFEYEVLKPDTPVVVDFWAPWCGPCKRLSPILEELANQYEGKIIFAKLNVDENEKLSSEYQINAIPHLIIFNKGKVVEHIIGLHSKLEIEEILKSLFD
jgi:thioredoxin 1